MNQFINTIFVASLCFAAYSALAEDKTNTKDSIGVKKTIDNVKGNKLNSSDNKSVS